MVVADAGAADGGAWSWGDAAISIDAGSCAEVAVELTPQIPNVLLLVDRSGSMDNDFPGAEDRWEAVYATLMAAPGGIVMALQDEVRFGLALYTKESSCPDLRQVPLAMHNYDAINGVYAPARPGSGTPTGESIMAVTPGLASYPEEGPKVIVLATDGLPDTCADGDTTDAARALAVSAVQQAHVLGIQTYVISVGPDVAQTHLQALANAGQGLAVGGAANAPYYQALDAGALVTAFEQVIGDLAGCTFALNGTVTDGAGGRVTLDGAELPDDQWRLADPMTLELLGAACETLLAGGDHSIAATFSCEDVQID